MKNRPSSNTGRDPDLGDQLRDAIAADGRSASELARAAEVDPAQVHRFLAGQRDLRLATAGYLCRVLGLRLVGQARSKGRPRAAPKPTATERPGMFNDAGNPHVWPPLGTPATERPEELPDSESLDATPRTASPGEP
jgi:hypothetical protein